MEYAVIMAKAESVQKSLLFWTLFICFVSPSTAYIPVPG